MALTFLDLTNDVLLRLNEVQLTPANFNESQGIYKDAQHCVNAAINKINRDVFEWPFNHAKEQVLLVPGQNTYPNPPDAKSIAFDTFRIKRDNSLGANGSKLEVVDYEEFLENHPDFDDEPDANQWGLPRYIIRNRDLTYTLYPTPREAYTLVYDYYRIPDELTNWEDETTLPDFFRWIIVEGAMYHAHIFRGAVEEAAASNALFEEGIKDMRSLFVNRYEYVRSSIIRR